MVRVKYRYIVVQMQLEEENEKKLVKFGDSSLSQCILKNVQKYYGDFGVAAIKYGLRLKYCNEQTRVAIIRVRHKPHRFVTSILPLITVIGEHRAKFRIIYNGATIMQCNKHIVKFQQNYLDKRLGKQLSAKDRDDLLRNVLDVGLV